jgi:hypothetical protein
MGKVISLCEYRRKLHDERPIEELFQDYIGYQNRVQAETKARRDNNSRVILGIKRPGDKK